MSHPRSVYLHPRHTPSIVSPCPIGGNFCVSPGYSSTTVPNPIPLLREPGDLAPQILDFCGLLCDLALQTRNLLGVAPARVTASGTEIGNLSGETLKLLALILVKTLQLA
ncbi:uncharacterized protein IUM83_16402 [Phytophthora cinnamomi]|uniref:uncharacterized protein n=1 Tax=Phytophthora cinnamomi TaxID=4785 RepID=UPI00355A083F|nr:hypothetical protein IUM83_16402 [Phytophthora cinnamomi]